MSNKARRKRRRRGAKKARERALAAENPHPDGHRGRDRREVVLAATASLEADGGFDPAKVTDEGGNLGGGVIPNVAALTAGMAFPAGGEPFMVDEVMLQQCADGINARPGGLKSRASHPELAGGVNWVGGDSIFHLVGRAVEARVVDGRQVRADMHIGEYADDGPSGAMGRRLRSMARRAPQDLGISIRYLAGAPEIDEQGVPHDRVLQMIAADFVGSPGGNPEGLLSGGEDTKATEPGRTDGSGGGTANGERTMKINKRQRAYLVSCGLAKDADDGAVQAFLSGFQTKPEQTEYLKSLAGPEPTSGPEKPAGEPKPAEPKAQTPPAEATNLAGDEAARKAAEKALADDRERRKQILALAQADGDAVPVETARAWADDGVSLADAKRLAELARTMRAVPTGRVEGGEDRNLSTLREGVTDALLLRAGWGGHGRPLMTFDPVTGLAAREEDGRITARQPHERARQMRRMPVCELARAYLAAVGAPAQQLTQLSGEEVVNVASCRRAEFPERLRAVGGDVSLAMSTSDFPYILADAMNKVFLGGYNLAPGTWNLWCRRQTAKDFKDVKLLNLSAAPGLTERAEGAGLTFGTMTESREVVALVEYTAALRWTRRAQINDDLGVLRDGGAMALGARARYKEDDVVYAILTANAAMSDGTELFHADHGNLSSGSSTAVYAAAAPGLHPTVVALFLESEQTPVLKQEVQWDTDDLKVAVRHSVAGKAAGWRGLYKDVTGNVTVQSLAAIVEAMTTQTDPSGAYLNLRPAFLLCPAGTKEVAFAQLVGSSVDPTKSNATMNPFFNKLTVIGEPRLTA